VTVLFPLMLKILIPAVVFCTVVTSAPWPIKVRLLLTVMLCSVMSDRMSMMSPLLAAVIAPAIVEWVPPVPTVITAACAGAITSAILRLRATGDAGNGTIRVYGGSHNSWTETTLTDANKPATGSLLDTAAGSFAIGQWVEFDVTSWITANGPYTFVIALDTGGNDIWFSSSEGSDPPELVITTAPTP